MRKEHLIPDLETGLEAEINILVEILHGSIRFDASTVSHLIREPSADPKMSVAHLSALSNGLRFGHMVSLCDHVLQNLEQKYGPLDMSHYQLFLKAFEHQSQGVPSTELMLVAVAFFGAFKARLKQSEPRVIES